MFIPPGIPPEHIVPELRATERLSAIRELLQHLIHVGTVPSEAEESLFAALCLRESTMATGVGFGIAIPHINSEVVSKRVMALGRSNGGIDFSSINGKLARKVILMISPNRA